MSIHEASDLAELPDGETMATTTRRKLLPLAGPECCPNGLAEPLDRATAESLALLIKAVADPARLQLLALLRDVEEACVCDLTEPLGLSQPTVSHHLKVLTDAGLLTRDKRGTWAWYALVPERLAQIAAVFAVRRQPAMSTTTS